MDDLSTGQSGKILAKSLNVRIHYVGGGAKLPSLTLSWTERQLSQFSPEADHSLSASERKLPATFLSRPIKVDENSNGPFSI